MTFLGFLLSYLINLRTTIKTNSRLILAFVAVSLFAFANSMVSAQTLPTISYQGLLENNGAPMSGPVSLKILIYTAATGGSPFYSETQSVDVTNGIFNVTIGSVTPLLPRLDFHSQYYLAVSVNGGAELTPRSLVSFAPYAFRALSADSASYSTTAARATIASGVEGGVVTSMNSLYGPLTLTGSNGITITNSPGNITISNGGNSVVQSVNTAAGKLTLVGSGGTTIADTGTTITIHSQTFTGGTGIQAVQNTDGTLAIQNGNGPTATISFGNDSIKNLKDARDDGSNIYLGAGSGVNDPGKNKNLALGIGAMHSNITGTVNVATGDSALSYNTTGTGNAALGYDALHSNTSGFSNSGFGDSALFVNTTGYENTALGYLCLMSNKDGWDNIAIGNQALKSNFDGNGEIAIGRLALYSAINDAGSNIAIGNEALYLNYEGGVNVAIGEQALYANTTGGVNDAIGEETLAANTTGSYNEAIGSYALGSNRIDSFLVAIGDSALFNDGWSFAQNSHTTLDSGSANTAVGSKALARNSTGAYNTGMGYRVLFSNSRGYRNTALGSLALAIDSNGNDNTAIGSSAGPTSSYLSNTTTLGSGALATANGQVVLGNSSVTSLYCQGAYAATTANSANLVVTSTGQIMRSTSSARYKTNIHDLDINTDKLYDLQPVSYTSKIDGKEYFGLVAEDVAKVIPEMAEYARSKDVIPGSNSDALIPDAVKYPMLSVLLLEELKKDHAEMEAQKQINADLERRIEALEALQKTARK